MLAKARQPLCYFKLTTGRFGSTSVPKRQQSCFPAPLCKPQIFTFSISSSTSGEHGVQVHWPGTARDVPGATSPHLDFLFPHTENHSPTGGPGQAPQAWCSARAAALRPEAGLQHLPSPGGTQHGHSPKPRRALLVGSTHTVLICKLSQPGCNGFVDATQLTSLLSWGFSLSFGQF